MKNFRDYITESTKANKFIIKFANKPSDENLSVIESWLKRYNLIEMAAPVLIEDSHCDFIDIPTKSVHSVTIILGMPVSQYMLLQDLKTAINMPEKLMVIRSENEPIEQYAQFDAWSRAENKKAKDAGEVAGPRLSTNSEYFDAERIQDGELFGNEYNKKLLSYLAGVQQQRPSVEAEPAAPLFSWIQMKDADKREPSQDESDFNAHLDTPKPTSTGSAESTVIDAKLVNNTGTMSDNALPLVKFFQDPKTGKGKQVLKPAEGK